MHLWTKLCFEQNGITHNEKAINVSTKMALSAFVSILLQFEIRKRIYFFLIKMTIKDYGDDIAGEGGEMFEEKVTPMNLSDAWRQGRKEHMHCSRNNSIACAHLRMLEKVKREREREKTKALKKWKVSSLKKVLNGNENFSENGWHK